MTPTERRTLCATLAMVAIAIGVGSAQVPGPPMTLAAVVAPFSGRITERLVHPGALVGPTTGPLFRLEVKRATDEIRNGAILKH